MLTYIIRRLLLMVPTLIGVTMVVFLVMALAPGGFGAALRDFEGTEGEDARYVRDYFDRRYGLDRGIAEQYLRWLNQVSPIGFRTSDDIEPPREAVDEAREKVNEAAHLGPVALRATLGSFIESLARYRDEAPLETARDVIDRMEKIDPVFELFEQMGTDEETLSRIRAEHELAMTAPHREIVLDALEQFVADHEADKLPGNRDEVSNDGPRPPPEEGDDGPDNGEAPDDADTEDSAAAADDDVDEEAELERRFAELVAEHPEMQQLGPQPQVLRIDDLAGRLAAMHDQEPENHLARLVEGLLDDQPGKLLEKYDLGDPAIEAAKQKFEEAAQEARVTARSQLAESLRREISGRQRILFHRFGFKQPNFGESLTGRRSVLMMIGEALPITLTINLISIPIIYFIAVSSGILAAKGRGRTFDVVSGLVFVAMWSIPVIWVGTLAIGYLSDEPYNIFPSGGLNSLEAEQWPLLPFTDGNGNWHRGWLLDRLWHLVLPVACMSYTGFAVLCKLTRNAMLENLNADFVRTARAKGVEERSVIMRHVFRNSLLPLITMFSGILPGLLTGSLIVENIFSIDGMGLLAVNAAMEKDREVVMAITLIMGFVVLMAELLRDVCYAIADPRVSYE